MSKDCKVLTRGYTKPTRVWDDWTRFHYEPSEQLRPDEFLWEQDCYPNESVAKAAVGVYHKTHFQDPGNDAEVCEIMQKDSYCAGVYNIYHPWACRYTEKGKILHRDFPHSCVPGKLPSTSVQRSVCNLSSDAFNEIVPELVEKCIAHDLLPSKDARTVLLERYACDKLSAAETGTASNADLDLGADLSLDFDLGFDI